MLWNESETAAGTLGLRLYPAQVREPRDFAAAFEAIMRERPGGMLILLDALVGQYRSQIVEFAVRERLPAVSTFSEFAALGGLMSYGPDLPALFRNAADYVDKVLHGAKPADLPFEQPTTFELVFNLKTAKAFGLAVPQSILARADELIE